MKFLLFTIDIFIISFSYIVPKKKGLYLFGSGDGFSFKGNPKYLYITIVQKNQNGIKPLWLTNNKNVYKQLSASNYPVLKKNSLKSIIALIRAEYIFIEITPKDVLFAGFSAAGRIKYIQTFHGTPLKKIGNDANKEIKGISKITFLKIESLNRLFSRIKSLIKLKSLYQKYRLIISSSDECTEKYLSAFNNKSVVALGFPRNDLFSNSKLNFFKNRYLNSIIGKEKVISYIPTFRDVSSDKIPFTTEEWNKLDLFLRENEYQFLIKKHPYEKNLIVPSGMQKIVDVSLEVEDVMDLLLRSDILVTDYSSVMFDFIITGKPVIYYSYDYEDYLKSCRGMYYDYFTEISGPFAKNSTELIDYIKTTDKWFNQKGYKKKYNEFVAKFNKFRDGNSSERLLNYLKDNNI